ncbi:hypothetical protein Tco_0923748 [Tanacetum coccineum]|uniref:Uncharacterized protein n=1 Tax=Tanacetum coccineum TaxID=301880 RepID=A0ABQ5D8A1_9ASTR
MVEHAEFDESDTYVLERFDTSAGNPVKEILLKLILPDHRSILTDSNVTPTNHGRITKLYSSPCFIANCFNAGYVNDEGEVICILSDDTIAFGSRRDRLSLDERRICTAGSRQCIRKSKILQQASYGHMKRPST